MPKLGQVSPRRLTLAGQVFGRWTVISRIEGLRPCKWLCRCECGTEKLVRQDLLVEGKSTSCRTGACHKDYIHGHTVGNATSPEFRAWVNMMVRCKPNYVRSDDYWGRGITVCAQWADSFDQFLADLGPKPSSDLSLDRIDNNGNYEPGNCRWATEEQQQNNKRKRGTGAWANRPGPRRKPANGAIKKKDIQELYNQKEKLA
jgi:hypothetical protein